MNWTRRDTTPSLTVPDKSKLIDTLVDACIQMHHFTDWEIPHAGYQGHNIKQDSASVSVRIMHALMDIAEVPAELRTVTFMGLLECIDDGRPEDKCRAIELLKNKRASVLN